MPSGLLFNLSRVFGLCNYSSNGKLNPWLVLWSMVIFGCWMSSLVAFKIIQRTETRRDNDRLLADSIRNLQQILHVLCVSYHLFVNLRERSKMEYLFAVVSSIKPGASEHSYLIFGSCLATIIVTCSWFGKHHHSLPSSLTSCCSAFSIFTDILLILQFCSVLKRLSVKFREVKNDIRALYRIDYLGHSCLVALAEDLNRMYDVQLLLICSKIFATIIYSAYSFYKLLTDFESVLILISLATAIVLCITIIFWLSDESENIYAEADSFNLELFNVMRENTELCNNGAYYLYVVVKQTVQITASGFFDVGYPLITSILAAATTYLVILIQFS